MLPLRFIREHEALVRERLATRGGDPPLDELLSLDNQRRHLLTKVESLRAMRRKVSRGIGQASATERESLIARTREVTKELGDREPELTGFRPTSIVCSSRSPCSRTPRRQWATPITLAGCTSAADPDA